MSNHTPFFPTTSLLLSALLAILVLGVTIEVNAQQGWEKTFGGDFSEAFSIIESSDGNIILAGEDTGIDTMYNPYSSYISKFNVYGDQIWTKRFRSPESIDLRHSSDQNIIGRRSDFFDINGIEEERTVFFKMNEDGNFLWETVIGLNNTAFIEVSNFKILEDGSILFLGHSGINTPQTYVIGRINADGELVKIEPHNDVLNVGMAAASGSGFYLTTYSNFGYLEIFEYTNDFNQISYQSFPNVTDNGEDPYQLADGDWVIFQFINSQKFQIRIDVQTNAVSSKLVIDVGQSGNPVSMLEDGFLFRGVDFSAIAGGGNLAGLLMKTDFDGNVLWRKVYNHLPGYLFLSDATAFATDGFLICGYFTGPTATSNLSYLARTNEFGEIYSNSITGIVAIDSSLNCEYDHQEVPIKDWLVTATKGDQTFVNYTDDYGSYTLPLDTGDYQITLYPVNALWMPCLNDIPVNLTVLDTHLVENFAIQTAILCPQINISQSIPVIRPCFERPSYINYCNNGTDTAFNAYIDIAYDSLITPQSSTIPWTLIADSIYRFQLGNLAPLACDTFKVNLFLDCDAVLGASYCATAHAFPDSICIPNNNPWSGAFIEASGFCEGDNAYLRLQNIGAEDMTEPSHYIVIEDILLLSLDSVELDLGDFRDIPLLANGSTYTLIADQVSGAPGFSNPIAVVEGCGENEDGEFTIGLSNQFPWDDENSFIDIDCPVAIGSFDPNDKQGFPNGYGPEHFIEPETSIEYLIRFQNTGTDTAFTVVIRDTLDQFFDLTSFQAGASSHSYQVDFEDQRILKFTFNNILLPDSIVNLEGSNGFVEYKIKPLAAAPLGTVLKNKAGIYFDFNEPVITNETFHTLAEAFIEIKPNSTSHPTIDNIEVQISPNPFLTQTTISIKNHTASNYLLEIITTTGRLIRSERHSGNKIMLKKENLLPGVYFYQISAPDGLYHTGKIIVH